MPRWKAWFPLFRRGSGRRGGSGPQDHPSVELLAAYHEDRLPPEEDEEIQEHFVDCPECPELMLDLERFTSPDAVEAATKELSDTWVESGWRRLRSRLADEARPVRSFLRRFRNPLLAWSCTAFLVPCTLVLWLRVETLHQDIRDLEAPQLNPPWWEVDAAPVLRGADPPPPELAIPAGARRFLLILLSADVSEHREYRLEIRNGRGESVWVERGLHKNEEGAFAITLSRGALPAGLYLFRVTGIAGGEDVPFPEEFPVRLTYR